MSDVKEVTRKVQIGGRSLSAYSASTHLPACLPAPGGVMSKSLEGLKADQGSYTGSSPIFFPSHLFMDPSFGQRSQKGKGVCTSLSLASVGEKGIPSSRGGVRK